MKKLVTKIFLIASVVFSLLTSASAGIFDHIRIQSAINTFGMGKCIDVANGQTTNGTPIVQFDCHNGNNQRFTLRGVNGGWVIQSDLNITKCVGINNNTQANPGELLYLVPCVNGSANPPGGTVWKLDQDSVSGKARFRSALHSSQGFDTCIDIPSGSRSNSVWLQLYFCHTGSNQQWNFIYPN